MKTSKKTISIAIFAIITFALSTIILPSCADEEEQPLDINENFSGLATDKISHTHRKGTDPCPQDFSDYVYVYSSLDNDTNIIADSASIENESPGLEAAFDGGWTTSKLSPKPFLPTEIHLKFTCAIAQSFTHTYKLVFFLNGQKVSEEDLKVDVTVI